MASSSVRKKYVKITTPNVEDELMNTLDANFGKCMMLNMVVTNNDPVDIATVSIYVKRSGNIEEIFLPDIQLTSNNQLQTNDKYVIDINCNVMVKSSLANVRFECTYVTNMP
jgi:hypothetical protein